MSVNLPKPQFIKPLDNQVDRTISYFPKSTHLTLLISAKGGSKTTTLLNSLNNPQLLARRFHRICVINPTCKLDDKWNCVKENDIVKLNRPLLRAKYQPTPKTRTVYTVCGQRQVKEPAVKFDFDSLPDYMPVDENDFYETFDVSTISNIFKEQYNDVTKYGKDKANDVLVVLDDCAGLKQWNDQKMTNMIFKMRHVKVSFMITTQDAFSIPKRLRDNSDFVMVFIQGNKDTVYKISRECACGLDWDMWYKLYLSVVQEPYAFLGVNRVNPLGYKFTHSFQKFLEYPDVTKLALEQMTTLSCA